MSFLEKFEYFYKTDKKESINKIINKLPSNDIICKEILEKIGNNHTKIVLDDEIKNSYYVYLNDTIYLTNKNKTKDLYTRLVIIAHECRHTLQNKNLQRVNFILSNVELVLFVIALVMIIFNIVPKIIIAVYLDCVLLSLIPRFILELDAVKHSVKIAKEYMDKRLSKDETKLANSIFSFQTKLLFPIMIIPLFLSKLLRSIIILTVYYFIAI